MYPSHIRQVLRIYVAIKTSLDDKTYNLRGDQCHMHCNWIHISHMCPLISYGLNLEGDINMWYTVHNAVD
jgi:hypothetical protein